MIRLEKVEKKFIDKTLDALIYRQIKSIPTEGYYFRQRIKAIENLLKSSFPQEYEQLKELFTNESKRFSQALTDSERTYYKESIRNEVYIRDARIDKTPERVYNEIARIFPRDF